MISWSKDKSYDLKYMINSFYVARFPFRDKKRFMYNFLLFICTIKY